MSKNYFQKIRKKINGIKTNNSQSIFLNISKKINMMLIASKRFQI